MNKVLPLCLGENLVHLYAEILRTLSHRFFADASPVVPTRLFKDPTPNTTRALPTIPENSVAELLADTLNLSSPGMSGHTWWLIKWAWVSAPDVLTDPVTGCLRAGHHPLIWRQVIVCMVLKPHCMDYSLAKNFSPVSLLECMGKLVEKLIARLFYSEIITFDLLSTNQFRERMASSTLNVGLTLTLDI